jgi:hypothetical protein
MEWKGNSCNGKEMHVNDMERHGNAWYRKAWKWHDMARQGMSWHFMARQGMKCEDKA